VPHTLLLADDSVTIQRVIELTFADEDVKVVAVGDGDQAIARLDAAPPDIVLADVGMPGKTGYEVARYVKQSPRLSHIPVVLLTGAFEPVDQARAAEAGCDGVLAKPFEPQLVIGRVKELLARSAGQAQHEPDLDVGPPPPAAAAGEWTPPLAEQSLDAPTPAVPADIANYFDRLDEAFANLSNAPPPTGYTEPPTNDTAPPPSTAQLAPEPAEPEAEAAPNTSEEIDWFGAQPSAPEQSAAEPDLPLSYASPQSAFDAVLPAAFEPPAVETAPPEPEPQWPVEPAAEHEPATLVEPPRPALPEKPIALPPLADAFAALLAAEQGAVPSGPVSWPASAPSTDALVDQISRRVLHELSARIDASVRDAVADLVSELAERLIRDEIARIKGAIK
jgi:CheY-like chemotaxis protein